MTKKTKCESKGCKSTKARIPVVKRKPYKGKRPEIPQLEKKPWAVFDNLLPEEDCPWTHVSLFSGCGGFDLGLRAAGFRTLPVMVDVVFTRKRHKNAHPSAIRIHDENTYTLTADGRIAKREPACAMSDLDVNLDITTNLSNGSRRRS